ncbi:Negative modulator of initiation of replication [Pseudidiomarina piscicola]|uniref:Negative modulator of initiation of replication n=1 Tax=Pseudidiomarina piscicola TaxID=2614830 RepID=A0A6S6WLT3_9GAMM|nr:replication initiation regulator SeqA [Pseudidiomarina piscicola]CAB0150209.1 Negative modulator of initiation of replication [Pseudidiomarina piscicola]VZT39646.1 Negative modulator of initiation of replication [Pseudomonas aeruginosa]
MSKRIEIDDDIYRHIASHTQHIGESASAILRRLLGLDQQQDQPQSTAAVEPKVAEKAHGRTIFDSMTSADLAGQRSVVARFLYILEMLHKCHPEMFPKVLQISGRDRQYFSRSAAELEASGTSTNPKQIPNSEFYVVTNNNTTRKKSMLNQVALELGYDQSEAEKIRDFL